MGLNYRRPHSLSTLGKRRRRKGGRGRGLLASKGRKSRSPRSLIKQTLSCRIVGNSSSTIAEMAKEANVFCKLSGDSEVKGEKGG